MKFAPKTEEELNSGGFENLPPGEYPFTVMESNIAISKSEKNPGREFVKIKLNVHGPDGDRHVYDQFADWFSEWKLKHFCETVGQARKYATGQLHPDGNAWKDLEGYCKIKVVPARGDYEAKNEVSDYLPDEEQKVEALPPTAGTVIEKKTGAASAQPESDDVPF